MKTHTTLTVRRPNGEIETVDYPHPVNAKVFEAIKAATAKAGRGTVLSYQSVTEVAEMTEVDKVRAEHDRIVSVMNGGKS
jgi:hypothetical protein